MSQQNRKEEAAIMQEFKDICIGIIAFGAFIAILTLAILVFMAMPEQVHVAP